MFETDYGGSVGSAFKDPSRLTFLVNTWHILASNLLQNLSGISKIIDPPCQTDKATAGMRELLLLILPWMCSSDGSPTGRPTCPCVEWANLNQYQVGSVILAERPIHLYLIFIFTYILLCDMYIKI